MNLDLAREKLMDHSRSTKNGQFPLAANLEAKLTNPVCGDHVELKIHLDENKIIEAGFKAKACAICSASASLLAETVRGIHLTDAIKMGQTFEASVMESEQAPWPENILALNCFEHLRVNPARKMCALLPWVVLKNALKGHA